jgi:hypothetical protein
MTQKDQGNNWGNVAQVSRAGKSSLMPKPADAEPGEHPRRSGDINMRLFGTRPPDATTQITLDSMLNVDKAPERYSAFPHPLNPTST